jgi:Asp-tRNA(Asn)/Glu-tRNA(Gln) amidotransferase C subunit
MEFLEFIQQELLPVMSSGTIVGTLERNLNSFNEQFGRNTHEFSNSLNSFFGSVSEITRVSENFQVLMQEIQKLNLIGITKTNIDLLSKLSASAGELDKFNAYLTTLNEFTANTRELNAKIAEQVERTRSIEEISSFLRSNLQQNNTVVEYLNNGLFEIRNRENIFKTHVISVEDTISKSIEALQRLTESKIVAVRQIAIQAEPMIEQSIRDYAGNLESLKMLEPLNAGIADLNRLAGQQNESLKQLHRAMISIMERQDSKGPMLVEFPMSMRIMAYSFFATGTLAALAAIAFLVIKTLKS